MTSSSSVSGTPAIDRELSRRYALCTSTFERSRTIRGAFSAAIRPATPDADRHPDLVERHVVEPDRGARDQHVAVVVEQQQDRARGADGAGDDPQHLVEQVVEAQVAQPGGRDRLEVEDALGGVAQLLALAHELAVRDDQLVVELEDLLDEVLLLADRPARPRAGSRRRCA